MATGGSTNHVIHLVAMARACGLTITWDDMADISRVTPLLARVYPNGEADVNQFHAAGGMAFVMRELINAGLAHETAMTIWGPGCRRTRKIRSSSTSSSCGATRREKSHDEKILRSRVESVLGRWRPQAAARQPRPLGHQDLCV